MLVPDMPTCDEVQCPTNDEILMVRIFDMSGSESRRGWRWPHLRH